MRSFGTTRLAWLILVACTTHVATSPPKPAPSPEVADAGPALAATTVTPPPPEPLPVGKPGWRTVPQPQNGFWLALDGLCSMLDITAIGHDALVSYGGAEAPMMADPNVKTRIGHASFMAIREGGLESIGVPDIAVPTSIAGTSLDDFWIADSTGGRMAAPSVLHWRHGGTWTKFDKDLSRLRPWVDGGVLGLRSYVVWDGRDLVVLGTKTAPPVALQDGHQNPQFTAFPTGEITLVVYDGSPASLHARQWSTTTGKVTDTPLTMLDSSTTTATLFLGHAPDELYVSAGRKLAFYDGTSWKLLATASKSIAESGSRRASKGVLWARLEDGSIEILGASGATPLKTPEKLAMLDGVDKGETWAVGASGKLYRREGEDWTVKALPLPAFSAGPAPMKAREVVVLGAGDVLVTATYWEKGLGWTEQEMHSTLLRTKKTAETLRCNEPDPENNNIHIGRGFQSWPPMATAECKTPFVVISRRSKQHPPAPKTDWAKIKAALKGHADLIADGKLVEIVSGDRTFLGARAKDFESAKTIAMLSGAKDRIRPEVLCAEPPPVVREVPLE